MSGLGQKIQPHIRGLCEFCTAVPFAEFDARDCLVVALILLALGKGLATPGIVRMYIRHARLLSHTTKERIAPKFPVYAAKIVITPFVSPPPR